MLEVQSVQSLNLGLEIAVKVYRFPDSFIIHKHMIFEFIFDGQTQPNQRTQEPSIFGYAQAFHVFGSDLSM